MSKKTDFENRQQDQLFKFPIELDAASLRVWRRLLVPGLDTLEKLYSVLAHGMADVTSL